MELPVTIPDLVDEANLLEWAGISFGKGDVYRLYLSVKKLAETLPGDVGRLRLFGKISTRSSPYYIVEGLSDGDPEGVDPTKQEGKEGANKYVYWVAQSVEATLGWVKLPHVTSDEVVTSRKFKRLLTGNLDAAVPAYPPFNGTEKNLLRAIIARIAGSTLVSPGESRPRRIPRLPFPLPLPPPNPHAPFHLTSQHLKTATLSRRRRRSSPPTPRQSTGASPRPLWISTMPVPGSTTKWSSTSSAVSRRCPSSSTPMATPSSPTRRWR